MDVAALSEPSEQALVKNHSRFPEEVIKTADELAPHRDAFYAQEQRRPFTISTTNSACWALRKKIVAQLLLVEAAPHYPEKCFRSFKNIRT